jgi:hypothetical protein
MVQVKADRAMMEVFGPLKERAEVLDVEGKLLGIFIPAEGDREILRRKAFADYESGAYQKRRAESESDERFTTEQVLERLRSLEMP